MSDLIKRPMLRLLVVIIDAEKSKALADDFRNAHVHMHYQCRAEGTASSEMLDYLGLGRGDKVINFCIAPQPLAQMLLKNITKSLRLMAPGRGIGFILPLSSVSTLILQLLDEETREELKLKFEKEVEKVRHEATHELIVAAINQGFSEELMEAARSAGATGGTVMHARHLGMKEARKLWGISVQEEKEVVGIVTKKENKVEIMKAISHKCGMNTKAAGLVFSLPVDSVAGLEDERD